MKSGQFSKKSNMPKIVAFRQAKGQSSLPSWCVHAGWVPPLQALDTGRFYTVHTYKQNYVAADDQVQLQCAGH